MLDSRTSEYAKIVVYPNFHIRSHAMQQIQASVIRSQQALHWMYLKQTSAGDLV